MRSSGGVRRHAGNAAAAASIAVLTSAASASGTLARTSPVAGLTTSRHSEECESVHWPLMKLVSLRAEGAATVVIVMPLLSRRNVLRYSDSTNLAVCTTDVLCFPLLTFLSLEASCSASSFDGRTLTTVA